MSSDDFRIRHCLSKYRHKTKDKALTHKRELEERLGKKHQLTVYHCRFCGGFHVGNSNRPPKNQGAARG